MDYNGPLGNKRHCSVEIRASNGCANRDSVAMIRLNQPNPFVSIVPSGTAGICLGDSLYVHAGTGYSGYSWNTGAMGSWIMVTQPETYNVTVSNTAGCQGHAIPLAVFADTNQLPQIALISDTLWSSPALFYQ